MKKAMIGSSVVGATAAVLALSTLASVGSAGPDSTAPEAMQYLDRYSPEQRRRHDAKPGITGWAQVNGRNQLSWEDKFALDVWYVDNWSLALDLKILLATARTVLAREGISAAGHATMLVASVGLGWVTTLVTAPAIAVTIGVLSGNGLPASLPGLNTAFGVPFWTHVAFFAVTFAVFALSELRLAGGRQRRVAVGVIA